MFRDMLASAATHRFDPEYFQKIHLADAAHAKANSHQFVTFEQLGVRVDGSAFYPGIEEYYDQGDLPFLRVADVDSIIDFEGCTRIPSELCDRFKTLSRVHPGDIVFTKGGSIARIGLVTEEAAASRDLIFLNTSKLEEADRTFVYLYSQTGFFNRMLIRSSSQTAQPHLTITLVRNLPVFLGSNVFKRQCIKFVKQSYARRNQSIALQIKSEQTLLQALGLDDWEPPEPLTYTRSASEALTARRLDADYFAPRVLDLMAKLSSDGLTIQNVAPAKHEAFDSKSHRADTFKYIEIGGLRNDGTATSKTVSIDEAPSRASQRAYKGDVITSTVRPIRRLSAMIGEDQDGDVCSSGFVVLEPKRIASEVLLTYLRLPIICELMNLHTSASLYPAISERDILMLPIPKISAKASKQIIAQINHAHTARKEAKNLLAKAKRAVELAIEENEETAMKYLEGN